ncbi:MAG: hypothetical protein PHU85_20260, partial [Phycisphaerae bacterium]|nr:hypothetical protein [Phycisphaerae bacterium]
AAANPRWTDWIARAQSLVIRQVVLGSAGRGGVSTGDHRENELVRLELPAATAGAQVEVRPPSRDTPPIKLPVAAGGPRSVVANGPDGAGPSRPAAEFVATDAIGLYSWRLLGESALDSRTHGSFAVNAPAEESNLATIDGDRLATMLPDRTVLVGRSVADLADKIEQSRKGSPLWPYLLAAVLVLLAVEAKIANRSKPSAESSLKRAFVPTTKGL